MAEKLNTTSVQNSRVSGVMNIPTVCDPQTIAEAVAQNAANLGWSGEHRGAFGNAIPEGSKVVIKPNLVLHENRKTGGMLPLVTHPNLIKAVVAEVLKANPAQVVVGDAPIQSCDFDILLEKTGLGIWASDLQKTDSRFKGITDFRRTTCRVVNGVRYAEEGKRSEADFVLFNLGEDSMLEPITFGENPFRVTQYDPRLMAKTHSAKNHQYLVSRDIIEADVVINLPKLKTHKKAGITNALKNLVGINGNKEYLPHHRIGGAGDGGDCYPGNDIIKRAWEAVADKQNSADSLFQAKVYSKMAYGLELVMRAKRDKIGTEGAWSGNETVARMCIDLNRILMYGAADSTIKDTVQRRVLQISDGIIAGQGDGPLASDRFDLGLMLASENASALDWIGAYFLGYDPAKIPLLVNAFTDFKWAIAGFDQTRIELVGDISKFNDRGELLRMAKVQQISLPPGWVDAAA